MSKTVHAVAIAAVITFIAVTVAGLLAPISVDDLKTASIILHR